MSEKEKQIEKERRGVLELLLQKNGLKRKELVDFLLGVWMAGKLDELTEQEKAQFPNLAFVTSLWPTTIRIIASYQVSLSWNPKR